MLIWILMGLDTIAFITLTFAQFKIVFLTDILLISSMYLILKGFFFRDIMSLIDLSSGIYILFVVFFGISNFFYYFILIWFLYKLIFTFVN